MLLKILVVVVVVEIGFYVVDKVRDKIDKNKKDEDC